MPLKEENSYKYDYNDAPLCPHCDTEYTIECDEDLYTDGKESVLDCYACGKSFNVSVSVSIDYNTGEDDNPELLELTEDK